MPSMRRPSIRLTLTDQRSEPGDLRHQIKDVKRGSPHPAGLLFDG
jgi:hypothetical protein